jgi:hypothetical protein
MSFKQDLKDQNTNTALCVAIPAFFLHYLFCYWMTDGAGVTILGPEDSSWFEFLFMVGFYSISYGVAYIFVHVMFQTAMGFPWGDEDDQEPNPPY